MKMIQLILVTALICFAGGVSAKQLALTFDDSPMPNSGHFQSEERTKILIKKLRDLKVPPVMIFANPCKGEDREATLRQLKLYREAGHLIGNHTCSHPRLDDVGFEKFSQDAKDGEKYLAPMFVGQKFFRFPYLNEGTDLTRRDQMRAWLKKNEYRNGLVSIDNDDYLFSFKINQAKEQGLAVNHKKVKALFLDHLFGAAEFYDQQAIKHFGRSPKHVMLLHEMDATVMYLEDLVKGLRSRGWTIISIEEAFQDPMYLEQPRNMYAGNGIIPQMIKDKTNEVVGYFEFDRMKEELNKILKLKPTK